MAKIGDYPISAGGNPKRSDLGVELIRMLAQEGLRIFSIARAREFAPRAGIKDTYLAEALYHLRRTGWLVSLRRGLYAISPTVPGVPPAHEFEIAMALVEPAAISHWSALHRHGLTDQAPRSVFVLTTTGTSLPRVRRKSAPESGGDYIIAGIGYRFVQVKPERFFGVEKIWVGEAQVGMTDPERTLLDGLSAPQYFGDIAEVLHAFEVRGSQLDIPRIIDYARRFDTATAKRLGWVLERQAIAPSDLQPLLDIPVKGFRPLDPTGPRQGPYDKRWMIQENLPGRIPA
jgi:predicted transcriptional regulator of viral defense system